jgi:hypothetical protein
VEIFKHSKVAGIRKLGNGGKFTSGTNLKIKK